MALFVVACGDDDDAADEAPTPTATEAPTDDTDDTDDETPTPTATEAPTDDDGDDSDDETPTPTATEAPPDDDGDDSDDDDAATPTETPGGGDEGLIFPIGAAGTASFTVDGDRVTLASLDLADGWQEQSRDESDDDVELRLASDAGARIAVDADEDDGALEVSVDTRRPPEPGTYDEPTIGGTITVTVGGDGVTFVGVALESGWTSQEDEIGPDEVEVDLINQAVSGIVEYDASIDDGELEIDVDTRVGVDG